jgi:hypothetical protein
VSEGLSEALVLNGTVLDPGGGARLSTSLECSLPKWPYPEMATEVFLMFDEVEVAIRGARPAFLLISAWTAVQMQPSYSYVGGGSVMIIGGGFSTSNRKYTCGWSSSSAGGYTPETSPHTPNPEPRNPKPSALNPHPSLLTPHF